MKIFDSSVFFKNQYEVDAFGAKGYNRITGNLFIGTSLNLTDINNLTSLSTINYLGGDLNITKTACKTLIGFENIKENRIFTEIKVFENSELLNLDGLNGFTNSYYLYINGNPKLENIVGLENITTINTVCTISGNNELVSLNGLGNLKYVPEIQIGYNNKIVNLTGLENIQTISRGIYISNNNGLTSLTGLENLRIGGDVHLSNNQKLESLTALEFLESVKSLHVLSCPKLLSLQGLENLKEITLSLNLSNNVGLTSLHGIENVEFKNNDRNFYYLTIVANPLITNLGPFLNYTMYSGSINFSKNNSLIDFCGITELGINLNESIYSDRFSIFNNAYNPSKQEIINGNCSQ